MKKEPQLYLSKGPRNRLFSGLQVFDIKIDFSYGGIYPKTRFSRPETLNPKPLTLNPKPNAMLTSKGNRPEAVLGSLQGRRGWVG